MCNQKEEKIEKLQTFDLSYFLEKNFFGNDGFQNMFGYQPRFNMLDLKEDKNIRYITAWKAKGLFRSRIYPLFNFFLPNIKRFEYKIGMQFNNNSITFL